LKNLVDSGGQEVIHQPATLTNEVKTMIRQTAPPFNPDFARHSVTHVKTPKRCLGNNRKHMVTSWNIKYR